MTTALSPISPEQGQVLIQLARATLMEQLGHQGAAEQHALLQNHLAEAALKRRCGTFVTLKIDGCLRGCIGSLVGREPICEGVRANAINAAFHDPRFKPLTEKELDRVRIEVSVLTDPQPLIFTDPPDLIAKLRPFIDGVILRKGLASATFLPQVWDQLPRKEDFLSHLCLKAGLSAKAWRGSGLQVEIYQVQSFQEQE